ncbi:MAG: TetR/AcrR family transcriptional regulator [Treponema sp.]
MANKNHELDKPIIEAAKMEFLQNRFQYTSINSIAKRAGVTTGAIYTRYEGKDELFHSLVEELLQVLDKERKDNEKAYMKYCIDRNFDNFLSNIKKETARYIDILFEYYDESKLLLCCSKGSSVELILREMMKNKISETKAFIKENIASDISMLKLDLVELLINQQFNAYTLIIEKGYGKDETIEYVKMLGEFIGAGWEKIFKNFIK